MTILEEAAILAINKTKRAEAAALAKKLADEERERTQRERMQASRAKAFSLIKEAFQELKEDGFVIEVIEERCEVKANKNGQPILRGVTCTFGAPNYDAGVTLCSAVKNDRIIAQMCYKGGDFATEIRHKMIEYFADNPI